MLKEALSSFAAASLQLVFPPSCALCRCSLEEGSGALCESCMQGFVQVSAPRCPVCGEPFESDAGPDHLCGKCITGRPSFEIARSWGIYDGCLAQAVRDFKFQARHALREPLASLLIDLYDLEFAERGFDVVVPVPLHKSRLRERGFDQSVLLAERFSRERRLDLSLDNLRRVRATAPQYGLSLKQREQNVRGAFAVTRPGLVKGRRALLVDDVYTTGSTARECARSLRRAGAEAVGVITVARAV